jgi:hypothetical protein
MCSGLFASRTLKGVCESDVRPNVVRFLTRPSVVRCKLLVVVGVALLTSGFGLFALASANRNSFFFLDGRRPSHTGYTIISGTPKSLRIYSWKASFIDLQREALPELTKIGMKERLVGRERIWDLNFVNYGLCTDSDISVCLMPGRVDAKTWTTDHEEDWVTASVLTTEKDDWLFKVRAWMYPSE